MMVLAPGDLPCSYRVWEELLLVQTSIDHLLIEKKLVGMLLRSLSHLAPLGGALAAYCAMGAGVEFEVGGRSRISLSSQGCASDARSSNLGNSGEENSS